MHILKRSSLKTVQFSLDTSFSESCKTTTIQLNSLRRTCRQTHTPSHKFYLSRGNSHLESSGSSTSMTPASIGVQLDERRVTRIKDVVDFPEELDSSENCGNSPKHLLNWPTNTTFLRCRNRLAKGLKGLVIKWNVPQVGLDTYRRYGASCKGEGGTP